PPLAPTSTTAAAGGAVSPLDSWLSLMSPLLPTQRRARFTRTYRRAGSPPRSGGGSSSSLSGTLKSSLPSGPSSPALIPRRAMSDTPRAGPPAAAQVGPEQRRDFDNSSNLSNTTTAPGAEAALD